jgi:hypothetical protein
MNQNLSKYEKYNHSNNQWIYPKKSFTDPFPNWLNKFKWGIFFEWKNKKGQNWTYLFSQRNFQFHMNNFW